MVHYEDLVDCPHGLTSEMVTEVRGWRMMEARSCQGHDEGSGGHVVALRIYMYIWPLEPNAPPPPHTHTHPERILWGWGEVETEGHHQTNQCL